MTAVGLDHVLGAGFSRESFGLCSVNAVVNDDDLERFVRELRD